MRRAAAGEKEAFAIVGDDGAFLGLALAPTIDAEAAEAELGYIVAARARGRGVASEALAAAHRWAFERRGIQRAYLLVDVDNLASSTVAERAGYTLEGVLRNAFIKEGRRGDTQLWSRLPGDPPSPLLDSRQPGGRRGKAQVHRSTEVAGPERVPAAPVPAPLVSTCAAACIAKAGARSSQTVVAGAW